MIEKNFVFSDIHYPEHDVKAVQCAIGVMKKYKPNRIIILGDFMDMTPVSHWMKDKKKSMENKRLMKDYKGANALLNEIVKKAGKQLKEVVYIMGNHEDWVNQYIDKHPEMEGFLEVENNIFINNPKVKLIFVPLNKFYKCGKLFMTHGLYTNKYHAMKTLESTGKSVMYNHTHDISVVTKMGMIEDQKHIAMSIGCLCNVSPDFMKDRPHNWVHACATVDVQKNGNFTPCIIPIINGVTTYAGELIK